MRGSPTEELRHFIESPIGYATIPKLRCVEYGRDQPTKEASIAENQKRWSLDRATVLQVYPQRPSTSFPPLAPTSSSPARRTQAVLRTREAAEMGVPLLDVWQLVP